MLWRQPPVYGLFFLGLTFYVSHFYFHSSGKVGKIVKTNTGQVRGFVSLSRDGREFDAWLGIPYAKPPIGQLRFAAPQPVEPWNGIRDATQYGGICAQLDIIVLLGAISGVEDCLFLNVYAPKITGSKTSKLLPVLFYIHGGYFAAGSSNLFRPDYFMDEDVIIVTINYRLGALGFLSTGDSIVRGNMGLKDQSVALRWVHENIEHFGGDPSEITIFGESAGAVSVHYHMLSPMSQDLIKKAISLSGSALNVWAFNDNPTSQAKHFAKQLNCSTGSSSDMVECLRNIDVYKLLEVHREALDPAQTKDKVFVPTAEVVMDEGTFLPDHPMNLMNTGKQAKIPWLTSMTADEGLIWTIRVYKNATFRNSLESDWTVLADSLLFLNPEEKEQIQSIKTFYFQNTTRPDFLKEFSALTNLVTDKKFMTGIVKSAIIQAKYSPVYLLYYNHIGPTFFDSILQINGRISPHLETFFGSAFKWFQTRLLGIASKVFGVCHGDDLVMLFKFPGLFYVPVSDPNYKFSKDYVKFFVSFTSNDEDVEYQFQNKQVPRVTTNQEEPLKCLQVSDQPEVIEFPILQRLKFWETLEQQMTRANYT